MQSLLGLGYLRRVGQACFMTPRYHAGRAEAGALRLLLIPAPELAVIHWAHHPQYPQLAPGQPQPRVCMRTVWRQLVLSHFLEEGNSHPLGWAHEISSHFTSVVGHFTVYCLQSWTLSLTVMVLVYQDVQAPLGRLVLWVFIMVVMG